MLAVRASTISASVNSMMISASIDFAIPCSMPSRMKRVDHLVVISPRFDQWNPDSCPKVAGLPRLTDKPQQQEQKDTELDLAMCRIVFLFNKVHED